MMSSNIPTETMYLRTERLRAARERRGLSQRQLSRELGIGENQINKFENGGGEPSLRILYLIAEELGVTADYLIGLSDISEGYASAKLQSDERQLLDAYAVGDGNAVVKLLSKRIELLEAKRDKA